MNKRIKKKIRKRRSENLTYWEQIIIDWYQSPTLASVLIDEYNKKH